MSNNIRKIAGAACRQRQYPGLCFVLQTRVISHQELGMIGRNIKQSSVVERSGNDRGVTSGGGSLNQELIRTGACQLLRTCALRDIQAGTVGQKATGLRNAVMGNLGCVEYSRWRKRPTEPGNYSPKSDDQHRYRDQNLPEFYAGR